MSDEVRPPEAPTPAPVTRGKAGRPFGSTKEDARQRRREQKLRELEGGQIEIAHRALTIARDDGVEPRLQLEAMRIYAMFEARGVVPATRESVDAPKQGESSAELLRAVLARLAALNHGRAPLLLIRDEYRDPDRNDEPGLRLVESESSSPPTDGAAGSA